MHSRDNMTRPASSRLAGATTALLAVAALAFAPLALAGHAQKPGQDPNSSQIILQHHPHTHAAATPGQPGDASNDRQIILQRHPKTHDALPAAQDPAMKKAHRR